MPSGSWSFWARWQARHVRRESVGDGAFDSVWHPEPAHDRCTAALCTPLAGCVWQVLQVADAVWCEEWHEAHSRSGASVSEARWQSLQLSSAPTATWRSWLKVSVRVVARPEPLSVIAACTSRIAGSESC